MLECKRPFQSGGQHSGGAIVSTCSPDWLFPERQGELVDWINLAQERVQLWGCFGYDTEFSASTEGFGYFLTSLETISFSRRTLLLGVRWLGEVSETSFHVQ
jgi:hypothetical protein